MPGFNPLVNKDLSLSDLLGVSVFVNTAVSSLKRKMKDKNSEISTIAKTNSTCYISQSYELIARIDSIRLSKSFLLLQESK